MLELPGSVQHFKPETLRLRVEDHLVEEGLKKDRENQHGVSTLEVISRPALENVAYFARLDEASRRVYTRGSGLASVL